MQALRRGLSLRWWAGRAVACAALPLAAGCDLGPDYKRPSLDTPAAYRAAPDTALPWPSAAWWKAFGSPDLDHLIRQAEANNFDIAAAMARIRQADAQVRIAGSALLPTISGQAGASWQHTGIGSLGTSSSSFRRATGSNASFDTHSYSAGLSASYLIDFWGGVRASRQAAVATAMFTRFDQQSIALTVLTSVATTWFTALSLADRLTVARNNLAAAEYNLRVIRGRFAVGTASALDVAQQEALAAAERALIPALQSQLEQQLLGLGILIGQPPERITARPGTLTDLRLPPVGAGLPAELLAHRPDVAAAEAQLQAQNFNIKVARAAFYPSLTLSSSAGYQAAALNTLVTPGSLLASAAAGLTQPIFDGGTLRGQLDLAKGRYDELLADYRRTVVQALTDVETASTAFQYATRQETLQRAAVDRARRAADIAQAQLRAGTVDITTVLQAQTTLFGDEDTLVQVRLARVQSLLNLYKALGGGWTAPGGELNAQFPGLAPSLIGGGLALPVGGNRE